MLTMWHRVNSVQNELNELLGVYFINEHVLNNTMVYGVGCNFATNQLLIPMRSLGAHMK